MGLKVHSPVRNKGSPINQTRKYRNDVSPIPLPPPLQKFVAVGTVLLSNVTPNKCYTYIAFKMFLDKIAQEIVFHFKFLNAILLTGLDSVQKYTDHLDMSDHSQLGQSFNKSTAWTHASIHFQHPSCPLCTLNIARIANTVQVTLWLSVNYLNCCLFSHCSQYLLVSTSVY